MDIHNIALSNWAIDATAHPAEDAGLINDTFVVGDPRIAILQRVNPIFGPDIHLDIEAITAHLSKSGLMTPRLVRTKNGALCVPAEHGTWRLLTYIPGTTIHRITNLKQAATAGRLVGEFHRATASLEHTFHFTRPGAHDTVLHMTTLRDA
ncbi:MAG: phosphotransferase, partial [Myxococcota bacterium]